MPPAQELDGDKVGLENTRKSVNIVVRILLSRILKNLYLAQELEGNEFGLYICFPFRHLQRHHERQSGRVHNIKNKNKQ